MGRSSKVNLIANRAPRPLWIKFAILGSAGCLLAVITRPMFYPLTPLILLIFILGHGWLYGHWLFKNQGFILQTVIGSAMILALISILGSAAYYLWNWGGLAMNLCLIIITLGSWLGLAVKPPVNDNFQVKESLPPRNHWLTILLILSSFIWLIMIIGVWYILFHHATVEPIRSPWIILPKSIWWLYLVATAALIVTSLLARRGWPLVGWCIHSVSSLSLAWVLYPLGYGFDPFIHQATEKLLAAFGTFSPAPPYYLGQYVIVTLWQKFSQLPLAAIDTALVPLLAGAILPCLIYWLLRRNFKTNINIVLLLSGLSLVLPLGMFIMTTPYNLALIYAVLTVVATIFYLEQNLSPLPMIFFSLAALATHALVGIPMIIFISLLILWRKYQTNKARWRYAFWLSAVVAPLILPLAFIINSWRSSSSAIINISQFNFYQAWQTLGQPLQPHWLTFFDFSDLTYFYSYNLGLIIAIVAVLGIIFAFKRSRLHRLAIYAIGGLITLISALLIAGALQFNFLIDYERQDFPQRVLMLAVIIISPLLLIAVYRLCRRLYENGWLGKLLIVVVLTSTVTAGWFLTYPNFDQYRKDRGYNTSWVDWETVKQINKDAAGKPYVVLANQAVAAAAITQFGFNHNFNGYYFYPIPTGGPLYQLYLDIVYGTPNMGSISKARQLTGVQLVYLVINDYWDSSDRLIREAQTTTPHSFVIGSNRAVVFKYD